ncbi:Piso0_002589 [Millerozyma farinosa CBS 7064]|uniref:mRNA cap guanine-N(7) methyltransferase n=1 Tax=Pichia sorbitophila (strain ATCC MYA-4447 / BCRC 22081 / CBS 7064 / NBRC 10061 / NRRL Y-12695) TaxID=559304 RepID=G8YFG1_PICSO|nr:Piso0_002589 [Millerozyma farinosa CBS 7064]
MSETDQPQGGNEVEKRPEDGESSGTDVEHHKEKKQKTGTTSHAIPISRRKSYDENPRMSSVYGEEKSNVPAWMKSRRSDKYEKYEKYDKYKAPVIASSAPENKPDERYNKYMGAHDTKTDDRIKRYGSSTTPTPEPGKKRKNSDDEDSIPAPYSNIPITKGADPEYQPFQSRIHDKSYKDINSIVRAHYNQRTQQSKYQGSRTKSPIYKMRNFNNVIKYILLGDWVKKSPIPEKPTVLLDLCCGKGGDLNKCEFVSIDQYIGVDISDQSIKEAFSRYSRNKVHFIPQNGLKGRERDTRRYNFEACFATGDCFGTSIPDILEPNFPGIIQGLFPVDCVSIQFALHYAFESEEKVNTLLNNVTKSLRPGGTFIGTIPSSDFMKDKIVKKEFLDEGGKKFGNELYSVTFHDDPPADGIFRPPFGHCYNYSLKDAIDDVPEYVVPFESFRAFCEEHGLTLRYKKNFIDIFNQHIPKYFSKLNKNLIEGMKRSDGKYGAEGAEKEAVGFYIGFVFEKVSA